MKLRRLLTCTLLLVVLACTKEEDTPSMSYLALGDSYTIGQSATEEERWPVQLAKELTARGTPVRQPVILARTGWRTGSLINAIEENRDRLGSYDMVSLLIGVNNQFWGGSVENYIPEFTELLETCIVRAGNRPERVFVLSIPDYGVTNFGRSRGPGVSAQIDAFNTVAEAVCQDYGIAFFNITPLSRGIVNDSELLASDGLHYSGKMYRLWVDEIVEDVRELLRK